MRLRLVGACICTAVSALLTAGAAAASTIVVHPGESIQAAIDGASPGDTIVVEPGTYHENLTVSKDNLTLTTSGGPGSVLLVPGDHPTPSPCNGGRRSINGICVIGLPQAGQSADARVRGTRIDGFTVDGFSGFGVALLKASDATISHTVALNNGGYGISGFVLSKVSFIANVAHDNGEPGFYIGDSPNARAMVVDNQAYRNGVGGPEGIGFLFRDSSNGIVRNNRASQNCAGYVFVDSGENPAPLVNWTATGNYGLQNNGACVGEHRGTPPLSGIGFLLFGSSQVTLSGNVAKGNVPSGTTVASGGIILASSASGGGADPTDNVIRGNVALNNEPFDVLWDGSGTGNVFQSNSCRTSQPPDICAGSTS